MKQLTSEIFTGQPIEVDFACVDYDGLLHFGKAINPRYTWASERWRGFDKIGEPLQNSGYEPLTSIRRGEQPQVIPSKGSHERDTFRESFDEAEYQQKTMEQYHCVNCMALLHEECVCSENQED